MNAEWMPAVLAVAAWPAGVVIVVLGVLLLVSSDRQIAVLGAIAELVRAARGKPQNSPAPAPTPGAHDPITTTSAEISSTVMSSPVDDISPARPRTANPEPAAG